MNERIRELAEQCYNLPDIPEALYYRKFNKEKFAELIVKECAGLVQGVPTDTMGYHTADQKSKTHFGIE